MSRSSCAGTLACRRWPLSRGGALAGLALNRTLAWLDGCAVPLGRTVTLRRTITLGWTLAGSGWTLPRGTGRCSGTLLRPHGGVDPGCG